jgi:DNA-binding MarR family transcriptional regulator
MNAIDTRHRYPWTEADERFLIAAKRERFGHKDIAFALKRSPSSINMKVKRLEDEGILLRHRKEELALLEKLLAEARIPDAGERS